jgi:hypothetical protein
MVGRKQVNGGATGDLFEHDDCASFDAVVAKVDQWGTTRKMSLKSFQRKPLTLTGDTVHSTVRWRSGARTDYLYGGRQGGFPKTHEAEAIQEVNAQTCCLRVDIKFISLTSILSPPSAKGKGCTGHNDMQRL